MTRRVVDVSGAGIPATWILEQMPIRTLFQTGAERLTLLFRHDADHVREPLIKRVIGESTAPMDGVNYSMAEFMRDRVERCDG